MTTFPKPNEATRPPRLLLLDTCGVTASVAVAEGDTLRGQRLLPGRSASESLIGAIEDLLRACAWRVQDLNALVVSRGPGSFTGIRVGLSAAKGLAEASGRPIIALSRLEVLATPSPNGTVAVLDAGRGDVFWAHVHAGGLGEQGIASRMWVIEYAQTRHLTIVGEADDPGKVAFRHCESFASLTAAAMLPLATDRLLRGDIDDPLRLDGLYLHKTEQETLARQRSHQSAVTRGRTRP